MLLVSLVVAVCIYKDIDSPQKLCYKALNKVAEYPALEEILLTRYPTEGKFWLHRTDTTNKLITKGKRYKGVELDIVFYEKENDFDNSHDKAEHIEYPLANMMKILGGNDQKIWLDYKNLTEDNAKKSLERLEELLTLYGVDKRRCIVESPNYRALKHFHDKGFYTSFYAPVDKKYLTIYDEQIKYQSILNDAISTGNVDAISFPWEYYNLVKQNECGKDMLLWDQNSKWWMFYIDPARDAIRRDERVKVILVKDHAEIEH